MKVKKIPMRMCVGCKELKPKKELLRMCVTAWTVSTKLMKITAWKNP